MERQTSKRIAQQGYRAALTRAAYSGPLGTYFYKVDMERQTVEVTGAFGSRHVFKIAKSWSY